MDAELLRAIAVTAELTGTDMSEPAARVFAEDLSAYPLQQVLGALSRCRREVKGRLTPSDVISRLDDGRPGAEEAWSMIPRDEAGSVFWTDEMARAFGAASPLINEGDTVAARMAFKEMYATEVQRARDNHAPVKWRPSWGFDKSGRAAAITIAQDRGILTHEKAAALLTAQGVEQETTTPQLTGPASASDLAKSLLEVKQKSADKREKVA